MTSTRQMTSERVLLKSKYALSILEINKIHEFVILHDFTDVDSIFQLKVRVSEIQQIRDDFKETYLALCGSSDEDSDKLTSDYEDFKDKYYEIKSALMKVETENKVKSERRDCKQDLFTLPAMKLPLFEGKLEEWNTFYSLFFEIIHNDYRLTNIQKMYYLQNSLRGEPLNLLKYLSLSNENYELALNILQNRYANRRVLIDNIISNILSLSCNKIGIRDFLNKILEFSKALISMEFQSKESDYVFLHVLLNKIDAELRNRFEQNYGKNDTLPSLGEFVTFLEEQCRILENSGNPKSSRNKVTLTTYTNNPTCAYCDKNHTIYKCPDFIEKSIAERWHFIKTNKLCFACLKPHALSECKSTFRCKQCNLKNHHTFLHMDKKTENLDRSEASTSHRDDNIVLFNRDSYKPQNVLLSTVLVNVKARNGNFLTFRGLIDTGSQSTLITEACANILNLPIENNNVSICTLGGAKTKHSKGLVRLTIAPKDSDIPIFSTDAIIIPKITSYLPAESVPIQVRKRYSKLKLSDPSFYSPQKIDILLSSADFAHIITGPVYNYGPNMPIALGTKLGFALMGNIPTTTHNSNNLSQTVTTLHTSVSLERQIERFWEQEHLSKPVITEHDEECEAHFKRSYTRTLSGRFCVRLPFKNTKTVGDSKQSALRRLLYLEKRFDKDNDFKLKYCQFMQEYEHLGHMSIYKGPEPPINLHYYIPHHGIFKGDGDSRKIRVVFDASAKSTNGLSLNDCLYSGAKLQNEIAQVLFKFRLHPVVFVADIKQMFRQIIVHPDDRKYQLILWRDSPEKPINTYALNTVTYGEKSSPYLSIRCIRQLAEDNKKPFPNISRILEDSIYVDDILTGASSITEAIQLREDLIKVLNSAGFELRKWLSNRQEFLNDLPYEYCEESRSFECDKEITSMKILGVQWNHRADVFTYKVTLPIPTMYTKRLILSMIARIYDPCGLIAPLTFRAKVIMQRVWLANVQWDESPPCEIGSDWERFISELHYLEKLKLDRNIAHENAIEYTLHGFSDASASGYAASIYLRTVSKLGVSVKLITAKTRVAPVRTQLTIPRLELNGAVLLVNLLNYVISAIQDTIDISDVVAWCDSTIALSWIKLSPNLLQTFEANRVSKIRNSLLKLKWRYVPSKLNPADCASRGMFAKELVTHELWWGPAWLLADSESWPVNIITSQQELPGLRNETLVHHLEIKVPNSAEQLLLRFNSLTKLKRITAWCLRFIHNARNAKKRTGTLNLLELDEALHLWIKFVQTQEFHSEKKKIEMGQLCPKPFQRLSPFIDDKEIIRVGGRLRNSTTKFLNAKHPIVLPKSSALTTMIVDFYHKMYCHVGPNALHAILQRNFWILRARQVIRTRISQCITCFKVRPLSQNPKMADLPLDRIRQSRPFDGVGVDFAGPFTIKASTLRNSKHMKAYLCVFVCLCTKAVHLETATDLSTVAFLNAFDRFLSRRGVPSLVRSDCGTNFVSASKHLCDMHKHVASPENRESIIRSTSERGISWIFNPPAAPNFGGLFEAAVKSAKTHLKRTIGEQVLTFEEFTTVLTKIEAVLNSRPLYPLSTDPTEYDILTPGHFLIGEPLITLPTTPFKKPFNSIISRFHLLQTIFEHFWKRWSSEYLHTLQQRQKWTKDAQAPNIGDLVLIKDDNIPPLRWRTARIANLLPGKDGVVRVIELTTPNGTLTRPTSKVCPLPL